MENELESVEEIKPFTNFEVFTKIWFYPRQVFKFINDTRYDKYVVPLLVLSGISRSFDRAVAQNMGDKMSLIGVISICVIAGGLLGWVSFYLYSAFVSWTGDWLKGKGDAKALLNIFSYAMLPSIIGLIFLTIQIIIFGNEIFKKNGEVISEGWVSNIVGYTSMGLDFLLGIWTLVLTVIGVSEVQKLSIGKSILNLLLPVLIFLVPLLIILYFVRN